MRSFVSVRKPRVPVARVSVRRYSPAWPCPSTKSGASDQPRNVAQLLRGQLIPRDGREHCRWRSVRRIDLLASLCAAERKGAEKGGSYPVTVAARLRRFRTGQYPHCPVLPAFARGVDRLPGEYASAGQRACSSGRTGNRRCQDDTAAPSDTEHAVGRCHFRRSFERYRRLPTEATLGSAGGAAGAAIASRRGGRLGSA